ncbi:5-amino-6-uracil reductase-like protein [Ampelomyces quisqualis]|uniref:2,5-diamino-6-ribosylamino-4(3H)-pyrimidinone 5'-phosphate reductase n=1 Tax=Ampelomyces quisqualis TaxID=50730 RepID=A0A6A5Q6B7_AMPQU|nr:5-amino-6-uracil reductase-like protein [Ampelomyces quisqualis]
MSQPPRDALYFPPHQSQPIDPYLPSHATPSSKPHVTLTFATSLDSSLSLSPGTQTALSGPSSKAMTHYLRSRHDAILIGVGTAIADDPSLNCRIEGAGGYGGEGLFGQPRPIVVDPRGRWDVSGESKVVKLAEEGRGRGVWILVRKGMVDGGKRDVLERVGGRVLEVGEEGNEGRVSWEKILGVLGKEGIRSIMIEGGGAVINELLSPKSMDLVDSVIVTIAPVWLGTGGVQVCPDARVDDGRRVPVSKLKDVQWIPLGEDVVLCGRPSSAQASSSKSTVTK